MALFHLSVTQTKRSAGQSAIASAAYRTGERLYSEYYGEYSDYTRKGGVICSDILLPSHAPPEYADRQTLWNAVEKAERGKNAQLAYSFDIALQNEFSFEENIALARQFLLENFVSRGMVVDFAVHQPDREDGGIPNPHFHVLCPILFSNESREAGVVPISAAVAQVNYEYNERLEELQTADSYDSISVTGQSADWVEVLAVFAVKVAGSDDVDAADVATMDADRIARLKAVFWDMTTIAHRIEVIDHPGSGDDDGWTERNLYITITAKTAEEMKTAYHFNRNQIAALDELLEQRDLLRELIEDAYSVSGDTAALIRSLPEDLSPEREAVVRAACSLVGKVNYFWGGKSLVIGWDARWGELRQVTAAGSSTTGTYRPYGLDCSGFVDWVFYNQSGGSYVIGHGGGATMQHSYCTDISWADAQPGDLVFYPDNSHVGIVGGRDANGELLIIHCASGYNNVVITGKEGFTSVGRPQYYGE